MFPLLYQMNTKLIITLTSFYEGETVKSFGGNKTEIRHDKAWNYLKRVWNDGHGLIEFASIDKTDNILLINELFCSTKEKRDIEANLKVPFEFVQLGHHYSKGLVSIRKKKKSQ